MTFTPDSDGQENLYVGSTIPTPIEGLSLGAAWDHVENVFGEEGVDADVYAGYASYQATDKMSLHGRIEYLDGDAGGYFAGQAAALGGVDNELLALTATVQYDLWENVLTRAEVRYDSEVGDAGDIYGDDDEILTFTLNAVYSF